MKPAIPIASDVVPSTKNSDSPEDQPHASDEQGELQRRLEQLENQEDVRTRLEALEARSPHPAYWWQNQKMIAFLAALLAAVVPITTAIQAWFKQESDIMLARQQQDHLMRMDYVKTIISTDVTERDREARLRLLVALLEPNDRLAVWAQNELAMVKDKIAKLETDVSTATAEAREAQQREREAQRQLSELQARAAATATSSAQRPGSTPAEPAPAVQAQIEQAQARVQDEREKRAAAIRSARAKTATLGTRKGDDPLAGLEGM